MFFLAIFVKQNCLIRKMRYDTEYQVMKYFIGFLLTLFSFALGASDLPRLISTAPSITETVKYLGGEKSLVGVSNFCNIDDSITRVGSAITPNFEKMVSLSPTKILALKTVNSTLEKSLNKLSLSYVSLAFNSLDDILESVKSIGNEIGGDAPKKANDFAMEIKSELNPIKEVIEKKYLWVISSEENNGMISKVMVAGTGTHYHQIIKLLGFYTPKGILPNYHSLSLEQIIKMKPDYIFVSTPGNIGPAEFEAMKTSWLKTSILDAVKNKKVYFFKGDEFVVPGTSILSMIKKIKGAISAP
ncbi:MAG: ABC transporter substrate-binding protein [Deltaproteobacteria bacterium]|nr:MAG: ABC transporter substrate-binding protein [Deltaproteobacteria bacterium]